MNEINDLKKTKNGFFIAELFSIIPMLFIRYFQFIWNFIRDILKSILIKIVREGPIPRHVSIIMDGNRRFAKSKHMEVLKGHHLGFETLKDVC